MIYDANMNIEKKEYMDAYVLHIIKNLGSNIKIARERRGLIVEKLAQISFCDVEMVEKIERGDIDGEFSNIVRVLTSIYMDSEIKLIACPGNDEIGIFLSRYYMNVKEDVDKYNF